MAVQTANTFTAPSMHDQVPSMTRFPRGSLQNDLFYHKRTLHNHSQYKAVWVLARSYLKTAVHPQSVWEYMANSNMLTHNSVIFTTQMSSQVQRLRMLLYRWRLSKQKTGNWPTYLADTAPHYMLQVRGSSYKLLSTCKPQWRSRAEMPRRYAKSVMPIETHCTRQAHGKSYTVVTQAPTEHHPHLNPYTYCTASGEEDNVPSPLGLWLFLVSSPDPPRPALTGCACEGGAWGVWGRD